MLNAKQRHPHPDVAPIVPILPVSLFRLNRDSQVTGYERNEMTSLEDFGLIHPEWDGRNGNPNSDGTLSEYETCSWCTEEVPDAELVEQDDGSRVCENCDSENRAGIADRFISQNTLY